MEYYIVTQIKEAGRTMSTMLVDKNMHATVEAASHASCITCLKRAVKFCWVVIGGAQLVHNISLESS